MKSLLQRVRFAKVEVDGLCVAEIEQGLLVFLGVEKDDSEEQAAKLISRLLAYRIFADDEGRMNKSVTDINGGVLLVSQFTLAADTKKGLRPGFSTAADPVRAENLYDYAVEDLSAKHANVAFGRFGADMQISLLNDGPVTFLLEA
ncbi:D-aminoacyl-tRNA deacylase [Zhongshania sp.]|uniref:D-aminoacyl-tRNA deacylase n=1 Tax=Zhongshania sp. TaxID=1971902 RepID=UPI001B4881BA|nr:D-aminoacyl-tRNA deacylase [Zhongshania sp.]MBQ0794453.1 D-tyrosyl-tRNA(Tyr) deacylase [Zhongshania sp.]